MQPLRFEFRPYRRPFRQPIKTSHGEWKVREGIILRLTDERERSSLGEIAPIPWFGSETLEQALEFCCQLSPLITQETIFAIPSVLPACQFGFESAWNWLETGSRERKTQTSVQKTADKRQPCSPFPISYYSTQNPKLLSPLSSSALLPAGIDALHSWKPLWEKGYRTFKWKIGTAAAQDEISMFEQLIESLPATAKLRLDANGGLSWDQAKQWLQACDRTPIEVLEQPLSPTQFDAMLKLSEHYSTPLALDESVATLDQLNTCYQRGWRGIFVIKPAIVGSPACLRSFCQETEIDTIFSSVFETALGQQAGLRLAAEIMTRDRAVGFGINHWFSPSDPLNCLDAQELWKHL